MTGAEQVQVTQRARDAAKAFTMAIFDQDNDATETAARALQAFARFETEVRHTAQSDLLAAMREARDRLLTGRDYVSDAARGFLTYEDSGDSFVAMAEEDLVHLDAALANLAAAIDQMGGG